METTVDNNIKSETIVSGNFSPAGNFSAYNVAGTRYFVNKMRMESIGIKTNEEFQKAQPIFAVVATKEYNEFNADTKEPVLDAEGKVKTFTRDTATAVFLKEDDANRAVMSSAIMKQKQDDLLATVRAESSANRAQAKMTNVIAMNNIAKEAGITEETLNKLLSI